MTNTKKFTFKYIEEQFKSCLEKDYNFLTCIEYVKRKQNLPKKIIINRVDIDYSVKKAERILEIFDNLKIKGTFFVRLHAKEYNPFSFENYRILKAIRDSGHEIGYHSEIVDQSIIWNENANECLRKDIEILEHLLDLKINGVASHGGLTGYNNLSFWKNFSPEDFGLEYEAYDNEFKFGLFKNSLYISDSEWTHWKCYKNGIICENDFRSLRQHVCDNPPVIYSLIHPDTFFERHFYE